MDITTDYFGFIVEMAQVHPAIVPCRITLLHVAPLTKDLDVVGIELEALESAPWFYVIRVDPAQVAWDDAALHTLGPIGVHCPAP